MQKSLVTLSYRIRARKDWTVAEDWWQRRTSVTRPGHSGTRLAGR
jgi:hypothetical protein